MSDFLDSLERDSSADFGQVTALLQQTANNGPPRNGKRSRPLAGGVFELKTRGGIRIIGETT